MARNSLRPTSLRLHRRQRFWQILFPVLLFSGLILVMAAFIVGAEAGQTRLWSDVAIILLITPMLMLALLVLLILLVLIYGLARLKRVIPNATGRAQDLAGKVSAGVQRTAGWVGKPFEWLEEALTTIKALFGILLRK